MAQVRGFTLVETLVAVTMIGLLLTLLTILNFGEMKQDLRDSRARNTATRELWLIRMDAPNQDFWLWTDDNGTEWVLSGSSNRVIELGETNDG